MNRNLKLKKKILYKTKKRFLTQTSELRVFDKLLDEYENNKNEETKKKLTEEFEKLNPTILKDSKKLWESLTKRYNKAIGLESE